MQPQRSTTAVLEKLKKTVTGQGAQTADDERMFVLAMVSDDVIEIMDDLASSINALINESRKAKKAGSRPAPTGENAP